MSGSHARPCKVRRNLLAVAVACCFAPASVLANPTGAAVAHGQASFSTQGKVLTVTNTPGAIINWQSFSIAAGETTRFVQQSAASSVLNRVVGGQASSILGALQSNGRVFLVNPSGILFGAGAVIDTAGLVASTLNIMDADFLLGKMRFGNTPGAKSIVNEGEIRTPAGGKVFLISPEGVTNSGIIHTPKGEVILAAGKTIEIADSAHPEVRIEVSAPDAQALNLGKIVAESGRVGIYGSLVTNRGVVSADSAVFGENGKIVLRASRDATLAAGSVTSASGPSGGSVSVEADGTSLVAGEVRATATAGAGGEVRVLGNNVGVTDNARIDVSGGRGGGTALVGGDLRGENPELRNARMTYVGADAHINADALAAGDGGKVIVWADDTTRSYGHISARGGEQAGNGGFVETSGKRVLDVRRGPDLRAPAGRGGTWLLDPNDIEIVAGLTLTSNSGAPFFAPVGDSSQIGVDLINAQLDFGSDVVINTTSQSGSAGTQAGNITVSAPIVKSLVTPTTNNQSAPATQLRLQAHNDIVIGPTGSITSTGDPLNVVLEGRLANTNAGGSITIAGPISTRGGSLSARAQNGVATNALINTIAPPLANNPNVFGGSVAFVSGTGPITVGAGVSSGASFTATGSGAVTVNTPITTGTFGSVSLNSTTDAVSTAAAITAGSSFSASGTSGVTIGAPVSTGSPASFGSFSATSSNGTTTIAANVSATGSVTLSGRTGVRVASGTQVAAGTFGSFSATVNDPSSGSNLAIESGAAVSASSASLVSDNMDIQGFVVANNGNMTVRQSTPGRAINLGTESAGALSLTQAELDHLLTAGSFTLGNASGGPITVASPITSSLSGLITLASNSDYTQNASVSLAGRLSLNAPAVAINAPLAITGGQELSVTANTLKVDGTITTTGAVNVNTRTFGQPIALGVAAPTGAGLEMTAAQLNNINAPTLRLTTSGPITIAGPIAPPGISTLKLTSSANSIMAVAGASIGVQNLAAQAATSIDLQQDNDVTNFAANTCCTAGSINFVNKPNKTLTIATVDGVSGVRVDDLGNIMVQADDLNLVNSVLADSGSVKVLPRQAGTTVTLGTNTGGTLGLTDGETRSIFTDTLTIAGDRINIDAPVTFFASSTALTPLTAGRAVSIGATKTNPAALEFTPAEIGLVTTTGQLTLGGPSAGPVSLNSALATTSAIGLLKLQSGDVTTGITIAPGANLSATGSVALHADTLSIGANVSSTNGGIDISTQSPGRNLDVGTETAGTAALSTAEVALLGAPNGSLSFTSTGGNAAVTTAVTIAGGAAKEVAVIAGGTASVDAGSSLTAPNDVRLKGTSVNIAGPINAGRDASLVGDAINVAAAVVAGSDINVVPGGARTISLGTEVGSSLSLTQAELTNLQPARILRIGSRTSATDTIDVTAPITLRSSQALTLESATGSVTQTGGAIAMLGGNLAVHAEQDIVLTQANVAAKVALKSETGNVSFVRAPEGGAGAVVVDAIDGIAGVSAALGTGAVALTADRIDINTADPNVFIQGASVSLQPSAGGTIDVGSKPGDGSFGFTQTELSRISAGTLTLGSSAAGNITVSQPVTLFANTNLVTGNQKILTASANLTVAGDARLSAGTVATSAPVNSSIGSVTIEADAVTLGSPVSSGAGEITIQPLTAGTLIAVGGADAPALPNNVPPSPATLGLDATDLGNLSYGSGTLTLGSASAGDMSVTYAGALPGSVALVSGGQATFSANTFSVADTLDISANSMSIPGGAGIAAGGTIKIQPTTPGRAITLGAKPGTGLELDVAELGRISTGATGKLAFDTSGTLTTSAAIDFTATPTPNLVKNLALSTGVLDYAGGSVKAAGDVELRADSITGFSSVTSTGGGRLTIAPRTNRAMNVGAVPGGAVLGISPTHIAALSTSGVVELGSLDTTASMTVGGPIAQPAGSSALTLLADGNISQSAGSTITAASLRVHSASGSVNLTQNNVVGTVAGQASDFGSFSFSSASALNVGTVDTAQGISALGGTVTLKADNLNVAESIDTTFGTVTLAPLGAGGAIDLGGDSGFGITAAELAKLSAGTLIIGSVNPTAAITVTAPIDTAAFDSVNLITAPGGSINVNAALGSSATSNVGINANVGGTANINGALTAAFGINITAENIAVTQPVKTTSQFSSVNLSNPGTTGSISIGAAIDAGSQGVSVTGQTISINAPVTGKYSESFTDFTGTTTTNHSGSVTLAARSGTTGSSVTVNQPVTAGQNVSIQTDSIALNAPIATLGSTVTLQPRTAGTPISLGTETAGAFSLTSAELALIDTDVLTIGNSTSGPLSINAPITSSTLQTLNLQAGSDITQLSSAPIVLSHTSVDPLTGIATPAATLDVRSQSGSIVLPAANNINHSITGRAGTSGTGKDFVFNNVSPLKLQNLTPELSLATNGKVLVTAPAGKLPSIPVEPPPVLDTSAGDLISATKIAVNPSIIAVNEASQTQEDADERAQAGKEDENKQARDEEKKEGKKACS